MGRTTPLFRALNVMLKPTMGSRRHPIRAWHDAVAKAEQTSGIPVSASEQQWIDDYQFLINCVAELPHLSPIGWQATLTEGTARLANRLRIRALHDADPAIGAAPIEQPIFVVGLPRTATTLAHQLLAAATGCRGPLAWEMQHTDLEQDAATTRARIKATERQFAVTKWAPDVAHVHPVHATRPEESLLLLPQGLYHTILRGPMSNYRDWFLARDATSDYQYLRAALQVLQYERPPARWVLKYPMDVQQIPVIRRVFPGAVFVWTHRAPVTVMGSLCSLADLMQSIYQWKTDRDAIGAFCLDLMVRAVNAGRDARQAHPADIVDVPYYRLVSAPERYIPELYAQLDLPWTHNDGERLVHVMERTDSVRDRKHEYSLSAYGLDSDTVERAFGDYSRWTAALDA
ncbi:sulfotransferase [Glycomyces sp. A-F 0318]|uniref:sulfotransferase family protein n=1 Tax=Glycomyces amatae TaxID=2881355 RepID=UPI001E4549A4|nr:sulfotransferase [Glycomyces amatae]MCD0446353.1 sulfotransferase [Glycomyces amatae]